MQAKIRRQQPGCVYLWCRAHRLQLAVLEAVKHDDYLSEIKDIINNIFLMYNSSPLLQQEFKVLGEQLDKIMKESGGLKRLCWLASRFRAISMLANNYKVLCFHPQMFQIMGILQMLQKQKVYFEKFKPKNLWLTYVSLWICFQLYKKCQTVCVCSVLHYIEENIAFLEELVVVPGESFCKLCNQVINNEDGAVTYKGVALTLIPSCTRNQARNATECFEDFYDNFNHLMGDMKNYIKQQFATLKDPPPCDFTVFDAKLWPDNLVGFGQKEISNLVTYYQKHNYIFVEEKEKAINKWPLLRRYVKLQ